ncbi:MAG: DNA polymerase III subunit beta [Tissierellia bacterium]|nr:DNA polymerase III subunit beta [Tissierellia bacterium]
MKITINQSDLLKQINIAQKAISNRTTMQVLEGILFQAKDNYLTLISTDFDIAIDTKTPCTIEEEGSIVINSTLFGNIVRKLPNEPIRIEVENHNILIRCEDIRFNLTGLDPIEYPSLPEVDTEDNFSLNQEQLSKCIKHTLFSASVDDSRPLLMGILVDCSEELNFVSLDGYRLSRVTLEDVNAPDMRFIIPARSLGELDKIIEPEDEIKISHVPGHVLFEFGNTKFYTKLLEGKFVDYKAILSEKYNSYIVLDRKNMVDSLERISLLAREDKARLVKLLISKDKLEIKSNTEIGDGYEKINCKLEGKGTNIAFNNRYLLEGIKVIDTDKIKINLKGTVNPCTIEPVDGDVNYTYLVLPVKLKSEEF